MLIDHCLTLLNKLLKSFSSCQTILELHLQFGASQVVAKTAVCLSGPRFLKVKPLYSPILVPCDFFLLPHLKNCLFAVTTSSLLLFAVTTSSPIKINWRSFMKITLRHVLRIRKNNGRRLLSSQCKEYSPIN